MKRLAHTAVLAALLVTGAVSAEAGYKNGTDLTGTWRIVATIPAGVLVCPGLSDCVYPALATATSDGGLLQTAPISNTLTGHGRWKRVGLRSFRAYTVYFRVDPNTGTFVGTSETTIEVTLAPSGRVAEGSFTAVILDTSGATVANYSGTVSAERLEVE